MSAEPGPAQAAAFFDVDGTLTATNVVQPYVYLRRRRLRPLARALWYPFFLLKCIYFLVLDAFDRNRFNTVFYRSYSNLPVDWAVSQAGDCHREVIAPRRFREAEGCIMAHRHAKRRIVLLTGGLDFLIQPLAADLRADDMLAASLKQRDGVFTGELAGPPIAAQEKARLIRRYATEHALDLAQCYAYGDSIADLPMLEAVGHPQAVNPDRRLALIARARRWPVHHWSRSQSGRS